MEPRFHELLRDWRNLCVILRVRYIDIDIHYIITGLKNIVRHTTDFVISLNRGTTVQQSSLNKLYFDTDLISTPPPPQFNILNLLPGSHKVLVT